jgi:hypothetical protein
MSRASSTWAHTAGGVQEPSSGGGAALPWCYRGGNPKRHGRHRAVRAEDDRVFVRSTQGDALFTATRRLAPRCVVPRGLMPAPARSKSMAVALARHSRNRRVGLMSTNARQPEDRDGPRDICRALSMHPRQGATNPAAPQALVMNSFSRGTRGLGEIPADTWCRCSKPLADHKQGNRSRQNSQSSYASRTFVLCATKSSIASKSSRTSQRRHVPARRTCRRREVRVRAVRRMIVR